MSLFCNFYMFHLMNQLRGGVPSHYRRSALHFHYTKSMENSKVFTSVFQKRAAKN